MIGTSTLSRIVVALAIPPLAALLASCDGADGDAGRSATPGAARPMDAGDESPARKPAAKPAAPAPGGLANGSHAVFGLRMPRGMDSKGTSAPGVYRFEGPHAAALVESYLTAQLASFDPAVQESSAKLYRKAVVRKPLGGVETGPLAIRVHEEPGRTAVDVWLERQDEAPSAVPGAAGTGTVAPGSGAAGTDARPPAGEYGTPAERRRAVFEMLQKIERGEPLTKKDLDNPLFQ